jgi:hypothetical protein
MRAFNAGVPGRHLVLPRQTVTIRTRDDSVLEAPLQYARRIPTIISKLEGLGPKGQVCLQPIDSRS